MPAQLTLEEVRHVARLARLHLDDEQLEAYRVQLATIIEHFDTIAALDVTGIEPMAHPSDLVNRLGDDVPSPPMPIEQLLANAPDAEPPYLAVPKVLAHDSGG
jgi:aspartyl/glutamyl-tRNA(Asn/Gln) amidotransferase C subunit